MPETFVRRLDDQLVEAVQYTGDNLAALRAWLGGFRVGLVDPSRLTLTREHPYAVVEVGVGDWVIDDGQRVYRVPVYAFRGHCREVPIE